MEIDWLKSSNDNETTLKEKEEMVDEIRKAIETNQSVIGELEDQLTIRVVNELKNAQSPCDEIIADLNENLDMIKNKSNKLNDKLEAYLEEFESRKRKVKDIYGQIDDLNEWLDEIDTKFSNQDPISHEPELIKNQLNEQVHLNEEISKQQEQLRELVDSTKSLIRSKLIDDTIELKEKLSNIQLQSNNLQKLGATRLNELEQAFVIAQSFNESYANLMNWLENEIKKDIDSVQKSIDSKEGIKHELNMFKQIERNLQEKKIDFETMTKNGLTLVKLCNKNAGLISASFGGSALLLTSSNESVPNDCQSAQVLRQSVVNANKQYDAYKSLVNKRKEELENLLWQSWPSQQRSP